MVRFTYLILPYYMDRYVFCVCVRVCVFVQVIKYIEIGEVQQAKRH